MIYLVYIEEKSSMICCFLKKFILRATACTHTGAEGTEIEGQRENLKQALCYHHREQYGAQSHESVDYDLSLNQRLDAELTELLKHP